MAPSPSDPLQAALAAAFPLTVGPMTLECSDPVAIPEGLRATFTLIALEDGAPAWIMQQDIELPQPTSATIAELATLARERLAALDPELPTTPSCLLAPPFRRFELPEHDDPALLVSRIGDALREQAHAGGFELRFDYLANWPSVPRTIYFLDLAHAMLGGQGFEVYLAQQDLEDIMGVLDALERAGCDALALRMRQGIALCAEEGGAEFLVQVDEDWLAEAGRPLPEGEPARWSSIDSHEPGRTWWLVKHELAPALEAYVRAGLSELLVEAPSAR